MPAISGLKMREASGRPTANRPSCCVVPTWLVGILVATVILGGHEYVHHVPHIDFMPLLLLLH